MISIVLICEDNNRKYAELFRDFKKNYSGHICENSAKHDVLFYQILSYSAKPNIRPHLILD